MSPNPDAPLTEPKRYHSATHHESASELAMAALDQVCWHLLICNFVLDALDGEVDLRFHELMADIELAAAGAERAFGAASLLFQGAALAPQWGGGAIASPPEGLFDRHFKAVFEALAAPVSATPSTASTFQDRLEQQFKGDAPSVATGVPLPTCEKFLDRVTRRCSRQALYLGEGRWARRCKTHASKVDRQQHQRHYRDRQTAIERDAQTRSSQRRAIGRALIAWWQKHGGPLIDIEQAAKIGGATTPPGHRPTDRSSHHSEDPPTEA